VKADTSLSKDQQLKVIRNLVSLELIDIQLAKDNTRYFCINDDKLINFENLDINKLLKIEESEKTSKLESNKNTDSESEKFAEFQNPFNKKESEKITNIESKNIAKLESEITHELKAEKQVFRKTKNI
jgi:hypothetical protein